MAARGVPGPIIAGSPEALGATAADGGVNFACYAPDAERLSVCLFDEGGAESARFDLPAATDGVRHGFVPGIGPGQRYGLRAFGPYAPETGLRFNGNKLLLDPYARALDGEFVWNEALFDFDRKTADVALEPGMADSAAFVPKCVVTANPGVPPSSCRIPWSDTLIYELNLRGFTMRHPAIADGDRGRAAALADPAIVAHLKALGVTSVELMPIHAFIDEEFLVRKGLRNFWAYNPVAFSAVAPRFLGADGGAGLKRAIDCLHEANIEVLLDVVYNHTGEGGRLGPTLGFRGLANSSYYRLLPDDPGEYINDTGCGNTINTDAPIVRRLIADSLCHWVEAYGVDGFRFDLATILGRTAEEGFSPAHPLFAEIRARPALADVKLIAEPWDVGPGGYRLGGFPRDWAEWNDRYRDTLRRFWRGDPGLAPDLARRVHGSADIFEAGGRGPAASVNFVASHDGFTTADLVSYVDRHNEANGEDNQDGHAHNFSTNHGVEGQSDDPAIRDARRRHRLNLLASLLFSQGTPMLLGGDEFGNSQSGNNNAYAQDNDIGWLDWAGLERDRAFFDEVCRMTAVRRELDLLRQADYRHGERSSATGQLDIVWFNAEGMPLDEDSWPNTRTVGLLLSRPDRDGDAVRQTRAALAVAVLFNARDTDCRFEFPALARSGRWECRYSSAGGSGVAARDGAIVLPRFSLACCGFFE